MSLEQLKGICHFISALCTDGDVCTIFQDGSVLVGEDDYLIFSSSPQKVLVCVNCSKDMTYEDYMFALADYCLFD